MGSTFPTKRTTFDTKYSILFIMSSRTLFPNISNHDHSPLVINSLGKEEHYLYFNILYLILRAILFDLYYHHYLAGEETKSSNLLKATKLLGWPKSSFITSFPYDVTEKPERAVWPTQ